MAPDEIEERALVALSRLQREGLAFPALAQLDSADDAPNEKEAEDA